MEGEPTDRQAAQGIESQSSHTTIAAQVDEAHAICERYSLAHYRRNRRVQQAIGEQFGFLGSLIVIALYIGLILRILYIAEQQRSDFSRIYAYCVASVLFFHFAINLSMTIGLAPVIGITLPFISYGGTSLLSFSILIFILIRLDTERTMMIH